MGTPSPKWRGPVWRQLSGSIAGVYGPLAIRDQPPPNTTAAVVEPCGGDGDCAGRVPDGGGARATTAARPPVGPGGAPPGGRPPGALRARCGESAHRAPPWRSPLGVQRGRPRGTWEVRAPARAIGERAIGERQYGPGQG